MMKKICSLLLSAMMAVTVVLGNGMPVKAAADYLSYDGKKVPSGTGSPQELNVATGEGASLEVKQLDTNETTGTQYDTIVKTDVKKYVFKDGEKEGGNYVQDLDEGDSIWLGVKLKFPTGAANVIKCVGTLNYDRENFEEVQPGDVVVDQDSGSDDLRQHKYLTGWEPESGQFSLDINEDLDTSATSSIYSGGSAATELTESVMLMIHLTVKDAQDEDSEFSIKNFSLISDATPYGSEQDVDFGTLKVKNKKTGTRKVTFSTDTEPLYGLPGGIVSVPVYIEENSGFNTAKLYFEYAAGSGTYLTLKSVTLAPETRAYADLSVINNTEGKISTVSENNILFSGHKKLMNFNFEISDAAPKGTDLQVAIKVQAGSVTNQSRTDVTATVDAAKANCNIKVGSKYKLGDVDCSGDCDLVDAAMLLQYYNGVRVLDKYQIMAGDINDDKVITLVDVLYIMKMYNDPPTANWPAGRTKGLELAL